MAEHDATGGPLFGPRRPGLPGLSIRPLESDGEPTGGTVIAS